ncbi:hypothetical protein HY989_04275 [Candidatus Micrarchaeota archaeon]|nr:hypothetical protein [Candidatus Micrarchaeota archaeon]
MRNIGFFVFAGLLFALIGYSAIQVGMFGKNNPTENVAINSQEQTKSVIRQIPIPAINSDGVGELAILRVEARKGSGKILFDFKGSPVISQQTQNSIEFAGNYALSLTGSENSIDLSYSIYGNSETIGGGSAGLAFFVITTSAILDSSIDSNILITGGIMESGEVVRVGKILEKAKIAKEKGYGALIVPYGEKTAEITPEECARAKVQNCLPEKEIVDVEEKIGIKIIEVKSAKEAYQLMIKK